MRSCHRILIVEDDASIRETLQMLLEHEGFEVDSANDGRQALEHLQSMPPPDIILLDLMMPVMTGWEFIRIWKHNPSIATIPVVVVSAVVNHENVQDATDALSKPVDIDKLLSTVRRHCA